MSVKDRPIIVSIYAILQMLAGLLIILSGLFFLIIGTAIFTDLINDIPELAPLATFLAVIWAAIFVIGLIIFLIGYGLWKLNVIAWLITIIVLGLNALSILLAYETVLFLIEQGMYSFLLPAIIQILLFVYFIKISDKFR